MLRRVLNELESAYSGLTLAELARRTGLRLHEVQWTLEMLADQGRLCRLGEPADLPAECDDCQVAGLCAHSPLTGYALQPPGPARPHEP